MFASGKTSAASTGGYQISRSLRFNSADSAYLNRTPASAGNRRTWTFSTWVKRSQLSSGNAMLATVSGSAFNYFSFGTSSGDWLTFAYFDGASDVFGVNTSSTSVFRDVSAWYHIVLYVDTTQATAANRVKIYVNNVEQTLGGTYPTQNYDTPINNTISNLIGGATGSYTAYLSDQYMTEVNFIDGQALTPSSFGETNAQTGVWGPKAYSGSYGTNGFYLNFSDNSNTTAATLGKDYSGNGNNWTPNNFSVTAGAGNDSMVDVPTPYGVDTGAGGTVRGNYCTLNPLDFANGTLSNGNLDWSATSGTGLGCFSTFAFDIADSTNKYYWEFTMNSGDLVFGIVPTTTLPSNTSRPGSYSYYTNGSKYNGTTSSSYGASFTSGAVIGVAVGSGTITFYKNGVSQGAAFTGLTGIFKPAIWEVVCTATANFGQRPFAYTAPSGFKALCTQNLPTPTIGATTATQAGKYFAPVIYTGTGTTNAITVGFQPDFLWFKTRSTATSHALYNSITGVTKFLTSNATDAESTSLANTDLISIDSNGFTVGTQDHQRTNESGRTYVAWNWKANGSGSTNTAGSITSTVSANTTSGFSVVTFTSPSSAASFTFGHGLGVAPAMVIVKRRSNASSWGVWHQGLTGGTYYLLLNSSAAEVNDSVVFTASPTSTVVNMGTAWGATGSQTMVAYCFAPIAGYSAFGSYTGNGSADGPFVFTGFRPAYVMVKITNDTADWAIHDVARNTYNVVDNTLLANLSDAEYASNGPIDIVANGFKMRTTNSNWNASSYNYIYICFASAPFKFSLAR